jgi:hypothetical protein
VAWPPGVAAPHPVPAWQRNEQRSHAHSLGSRGRAGSHSHRAKEYQLFATRSCGDVAASPWIDEAHANCSGWAQSVGAATATLGSHRQSTPSLPGHRPSTGASRPAHARQRNSPGRGQSQYVCGPASASPAPASADASPTPGCAGVRCDGAPGTCSADAQPTDAPATTMA